MSWPHRLERPIAVEIELPHRMQLAPWRELSRRVVEAGVQFVNLFVGDNNERSLALARYLRPQVDLALTFNFNEKECPNSSLLGELRPATVRIIVDTTRLPSVELLDHAADLAEEGQLAVVAVGPLPISKAMPAWLDLFGTGFFSGFNVEDLETFDRNLYAEFIRKVAQLIRCSDIPVLSDLPLFSRFVGKEVKTGGMCPAGRLSFHIGLDGTVSPCKKADLTLGTLWERGVLDVWNDARMVEWCCLPRECLSCRIDVCRGGCRVRAHNRGRDRLCPGPV